MSQCCLTAAASDIRIRSGTHNPCGNCTHLGGGSIDILSLLPNYMNSSSNCGKQVSVWDGASSDLTRGVGLTSSSTSSFPCTDTWADIQQKEIMCPRLAASTNQLKMSETIGCALLKSSRADKAALESENITKPPTSMVKRDFIANKSPTALQ